MSSLIECDPSFKRRCSSQLSGILPYIVTFSSFHLSFVLLTCLCVMNLPVSVLYQKVLLDSFHEVPEALVKDFSFAVRLAVYQGCP